MRLACWFLGCLLAFAPAMGVWALMTPSLVSPVDQDEGVSPSLTLSWDAVPGAMRYQVELNSAHSHSVFNTANNECALTDLPIATAFHWRVRAENNRGHSVWSAGYLFTTLEVKLPGQLVLVVSEADAHRLYRLNADGSDLRRLSPASPNPQATGNEATVVQDSAPVYSPDGQQIAFCSTRDGGSELYVMHSDGSGVTRLTHNTGMACEEPRFTPDGKSLLFRYGGTVKQLARLDLAGVNPVCLTEKSRVTSGTLPAVPMDIISPASSSPTRTMLARPKACST